MAGYSAFNLARHALGGHRAWPQAWRIVTATIVSPVFHDPAGERFNA